ncbi:hypothetical protein KVR01_004702 [Diaporthe batatas]|uniref:uncharacterized protein n=1 Tax=Diaporthe batatas TaxID=748121 RepID=UPI001D05049D|nr:uncharacterized protein KVR01_004702 [Diaporthe batatas]KAG8166150.1 hypothetical protein KVR01_004702 [Diaporthe batatas]
MQPRLTASRSLSHLRRLSSTTTTATTSSSSPVLRHHRRLLSSSAAALKMKESDIKRNPHPDFKKVEASRPAWTRDPDGFKYTQTAEPSWQFGSGANHLAAHEHGQKQHVTIDPFAEGRAPVNNYKLLISAVVPRPIAFVSTVSPDGKTTNLAPFSYFQVVNHDPPLFVIGFASSLEGAAAAKHTLHNLAETRECTVNIISEHFAEAANSTSVNAPYGSSEWAISGLTPAYDCQTVRPARVREAVFSIEAKLESLREFESRSRPGTKNATMAVVEGTRFWVREDAINEDRNIIDPSVLRPISRLGGITYGRTIEGFELPRPDFNKDLGGPEGYEKLEAERRAKDDDGRADGKI